MSSFRRHCGLAAIGFVLAFGSTAARATDYPLSLDNCGIALSFEKAPERVVSIGQSMTEIMYLLGLSDRVAGTALWVAPVLPQFEEVNEEVNSK